MTLGLARTYHVAVLRGEHPHLGTGGRPSRVVTAWV
jgi:hypothetical protein